MKENKLKLAVGLISVIIFLGSCKKEEEEPSPIKFVQTVHFSDYDCIINYNGEKQPISIYYEYSNGKIELASNFEYQNGKVTKLINYILRGWNGTSNDEVIDAEYHFEYFNSKLTNIYATHWYIYPFILKWGFNSIELRDESLVTTNTFESNDYQRIDKNMDDGLHLTLDYVKTDHYNNLFKYFPQELRVFYHIIIEWQNYLTDDINFGPYLEHNPTIINYKAIRNGDTAINIIQYDEYEYNNAFIPTAYRKTVYHISDNDTTEISQKKITVDYSEGF